MENLFSCFERGCRSRSEYFNIVRRKTMDILSHEDLLRKLYQMITDFGFRYLDYRHRH